MPKSTTELPAWAGVLLTASAIGAVLFGAAVAGRISVPVWFGWTLAAFVVVSVLASGYAMALRAR